MACHRAKTVFLPSLFSLAVLALSGCSTSNIVSPDNVAMANAATTTPAASYTDTQAHGLAWNLARLALTEKTLNATVRERVVMKALDPKTFEPTNPGADVDMSTPSLSDRLLGRVLEVPQWVVVTPVDAKLATASLGCSVAAERFATVFLEAAKKTAEAEGLWVPVHEWGRWHETLYVYLQVNKHGGIGQAPESLEWKLSLPCDVTVLPQMTREELLAHVPGLDAVGLPAGEKFSLMGLTGREGNEERDSTVTRSVTYSATAQGRTREVFLSKFFPALGRNLPEGVFMITPGVQEAGRMASKLVAAPFVATKAQIVPFVREVPVEAR